MRSTSARSIVAAAVVSACVLHAFSAAATDGEIVAWGYNSQGQSTVPSPNSDFIAVAAGGEHSLGLKADGSIVAWGNNGNGQCNVPSPNTGFVAVAAGDRHSLGLKADGTIAAWGSNGYGQCSVDWPNSGYVAVSAGVYHSLGLRADGSIEAWGHNGTGALNVPAPNSEFVAVAAGGYHSLGLKADGSVIAWGGNSDGQCDVPPPNRHFVAVAAHWHSSSGLTADGTIVSWGDNEYGQGNTPSPNADFVGVATGNGHNMGLKADGSMIAWGFNFAGQCNVPAPGTGFAGLATGSYHSLGVKGPAPSMPRVFCSSLQIYDQATGIYDDTLMDVSVTVEGIVNVAPETYRSGGGGYLHDETGGINFWRSSAPAGIRAGDRIRITGRMWPDGGDELYVGEYVYAKLDSGLVAVPTQHSIGALLGDFGNTGSYVWVRGTAEDLTEDSFWLEENGTRIEVRRSSYAGVDFSALTEGVSYSVISPCLKDGATLYLKPSGQSDIILSAHYVGNAGNNGNPGTRDLPYRTIQHAVDVAVSGDEVVLLDGHYTGPGNVNVTWQDKSLGIRSDSNDRTLCTIDGAGEPGFVYATTVIAARDTLAFTGITIVGASTGIGASSGYPYSGFLPVHVAVRNCSLMDGDTGVTVREGSVVVERSNVFRQTTVGVSVVSPDWSATTIRDCNIRRNGVGVEHINLGSGPPVVIDSTSVVANGVGVHISLNYGSMNMSHCRVDSSTTGDGLHVRTFAGGPVLADSKFRGNAKSGVRFRSAAGGGVSAVRCESVGNGLHGFELASYTGRGGPHELDSVLIADNGAWGIGPYDWSQKELEFSDLKRIVPGESGGLRLLNSEVRNNGHGGVDRGDRGNLDFANVAILDNGGPGVRAVGGASALTFAFTNVTIAGSSGDGLLLARCTGTGTRLAIAGNDSLGINLGEDAALNLTCTDIYGNRSGDWVGALAPQLGVDGNLNVDPRFCDAAAGDYTLQENSPLAAENNPGCGTIGRYGAACPAQPWAPFEPRVQDVPDDQGGYLRMTWLRHGADAPSATVPITAYDIQRHETEWQTLTTQAAAAADSYAVTIATPDVQIIGQPMPYSRYRLVARTAAPAIFFESAVDSAYSIDNLPPPKPEATLVDGLDYRYIVWPNPDIPDLASACVFRGDAAGFTPGDPLACPSNGIYTETHLAWYFYRVQFADIHGNLSEFSDELHGQWPTGVPGALPTALRLHPCRPNPFNPRTTITYDLPEAGGVRLAVFDLAGRLVRMLVDEGRSQGSYEAVWDGRDTAGREVGSGTYLARLEFGGKIEVVRLGLVR